LRLVVFLPVIAFLLCPQVAKAAVTEIKNDIIVTTIWKKANSPYVVDRLINIKAPLTIEPGVVVKFYDADPHDNTGTYLIVQSDLTAIGTTDEKIVFTSMLDDSFGGDTNDDAAATTPKKGDWDGISLDDNSAKIIFDHVVLSYAYIGINYDSVYKNFFRGLTIKNSEIKNNNTGLSFRNVLPLIENNIISNNKTGIATFNDYEHRKIKINNNSIFDNSIGLDARSPFGPACTDVDATYNWWGDKSGPYFKAYAYPANGYSADNSTGKGDTIRGYCVEFDPWFRRSPDVKRDPVILIPGIGASINPDLMIGGIFADNWTMFDRTYDGLIKAIRSAGYIEGKDFFIVFYDWRKSNTESAEDYLKPAIDRALVLNPVDKVNIVAHSMGGLVARSYVEGGEYDNDVNNLILIATPNRGSSDAYSLWEGGRVPDNWEEKMMMKAYIDYMIVKNLTFNSYDVVHQFIPSIKELMPIYNYIHPAGSSQSLKDYLGMTEKNDFLMNLNSGINELQNRTRFSIILGNNQPTVNKIPVISSDILGLWQDGKPEPINPERTDANGDGRVLMTSGDIQSEFRDVLSFDHSDLVSEAEPIIMARLLNEDLSEVYRAPQVDEEIGFWSEGPGDMEIKDPNENVVTKDSSDIQDSKFSSESKSDGFKIASIPNPIKGDYTVTITNASKNGGFHVGSEYVDNTGSKNDLSSVVSGTIEKDQDVELIVNIDPENTEKPVSDIAIKDKIEPTVTIDSPEDGAEYSNDQILPITFSVSDNISAVENIKIAMYLDDELLDGNSIDLSTLSLGEEHDFFISATDEADNQSENDIFFKVKKADPPVVQDPDPITSPIDNSSTTGTVLGVATANPLLQNLQSSSAKKSSHHHKKSKHKKKSHKKKSKKMKTPILSLTKRVWIPTANVLGYSTTHNTKNSATLWEKMSQAASTLKNFLFQPFKYFKKP